VQEFRNRTVVVTAPAAFAAQETRVPVATDRRDNLMTPVHGLHRTRGSFGAEACDHAIAAPGAAARLAPVIAGAALIKIFVGWAKAAQRPCPPMVGTRSPLRSARLAHPTIFMREFGAVSEAARKVLFDRFGAEIRITNS